MTLTFDLSPPIFFQQRPLARQIFVPSFIEIDPLNIEISCHTKSASADKQREMDNEQTDSQTDHQITLCLHRRIIACCWWMHRKTTYVQPAIKRTLNGWLFQCTYGRRRVWQTLTEGKVKRKAARYTQQTYVGIMLGLGLGLVGLGLGLWLTDRLCNCWRYEVSRVRAVIDR